GSLGMDLATAIDITLLDNRPHKVPTGVVGPLLINGQPYGALLLGRSSSSLKGLFLLPRVIEKDYTGEISIILQTSFPSVHVPKGSRMAQVVPLQQITDNRSVLAHEHGSGSLGSTGGLALLTVSLATRAEVTISIDHEGEHKTLLAFLDTGADISIIS
ncbi:POK9 protein, partial [Upupa epops]|nr:POK9 protein [Upupa epops]